MEEWRDIEEFKGLYQVSNYGRVRSVERYINTRTYPSQIIKTAVRNNNSVQVGLRKPGKYQVHRSVAKLVLLAFVGQAPKWSKQAKHLDGNPNNNRLDNLEWDVGRASKVESNIKAREYFNTNALKCIEIYISRNRVFEMFKFGIVDIDDYKQECLIRIWRDIDCFNFEYSFYTFCAPKCKWVLNRMYSKYIKKVQCVSRFSDYEVKEIALDKISDLGYLEIYDKEGYNG
ncbi:MAG: hypothetical protein HFJ98_00385 [Eubacterium sp.]|nr:hypothetical protein [Eubacterium sp.]